MSKIERFTNIVDILMRSVDREKTEELSYQQTLANDLKTAFVSVYGKSSVNADDCVSDDGYALIPCFIKNSVGMEFVGLVDICVLDGGELNAECTQFLTKPYGWVTLSRMKEIATETELALFYPFKYKPLVNIEGCYKTDAQYS
ncbi:hypothetical protein JOD82_001938 [Paenibacillus sp. 1182]|uniref:hypothetical protein n=1 Tax=Paenibacillus sp. 1182 TaxID=2806565 RepID=UPI001AE86A43|nr:hypothetical protein [Paenibacillus sp. 1182]MBP1308918.1 hypothetical protein [Paenibacillus sp. 1182]